jgi:hypothetical protein
MSSGRESDSHAKRMNGPVVTREPLPRGTNITQRGGATKESRESTR